jgi:hypothetical protein
MSTKTSNLGLIKPELTDAADITAMNSNWDKLDEQITLLSSGASKSVIVNATISASNWQSNLYTWRNSGITSTTQIVELLPSQSITEEQLEALQSANIVGNSQAVGSITFKAYGDVPTIDIPVIFIIRGDA